MKFAAFADKNGRVADAGMFKEFFRQHDAAGGIKSESSGVAENQIGKVVLCFRKEVGGVLNVGGQLVKQFFGAAFNAGSGKAAVADDFR